LVAAEAAALLGALAAPWLLRAAVTVALVALATSGHAGTCAGSAAAAPACWRRRRGL
jgi:hypothetical protein